MTSIQSIEAEADSLSEARMQIKAKVPEGFEILSEKILSDGETKFEEGIADTVEAAFADAESKLPSGVEIVDRKQVSVPVRKNVVVEAFDERAAEEQVRRGFKFPGARIESVILMKMGKKGFFGRGRKPNTYEIEVFEPARVQIGYGERARIRVEVAESPQRWAQELREKKDYRALAAINNSRDYDEPFHWKKRDLANKILVEAGAEAVDDIIVELTTGGVGSIELAVVLAKIGNPRAVAILKMKLDRGEFEPYLTQEPLVRKFVEKHSQFAGEVEWIECTVCGKTRPVTEAHSAQWMGGQMGGELYWFCKDTCWERRGLIIGSEDGIGCPYYTEDKMCTAGGVGSSPCSFALEIGPDFRYCNVYKINGGFA